MTFNLSAFHRMAAQRGDGLRPELAELLITGRAGFAANIALLHGGDAVQVPARGPDRSLPADTSGSSDRVQVLRRR